MRRSWRSLSKSPRSTQNWRVSKPNSRRVWGGRGTPLPVSHDRIQNKLVHIHGVSDFSVCPYCPPRQSIIEYAVKFGHEERFERIIQILCKKRTVIFGHEALKGFWSPMCDEQEGGIVRVIPNTPPRAIEALWLALRQGWPSLPAQDGLEVEPSAKCAPKGGLLLQAAHSICRLDD